MVAMAEQTGKVYRVTSRAPTFDEAVRDHMVEAQCKIAGERQRLLELFTSWTNYADSEHLQAKLKPFNELLNYWWS